MPVAWYVHPPALAKADYSVIYKFLGDSLVRQCGTVAICVRWIDDEQLKHCSAHGNIGALNFIIHSNVNSNKDMIEHIIKCSYRYM